MESNTQKEPATQCKCIWLKILKQ